VLTVHHLNESRSQRILWLLEELELPYEIVFHTRDPKTRLAPPSLTAIHPLGKSPVIVDGDLTIIESGAIIDYVIRRHGEGRLAPDPASADYDRYQQWLHYAEGSAMLPLMLNMYVGRLGEAGAPLHPRIQGEIANHLAFVEASLAGRESSSATPDRRRHPDELRTRGRQGHGQARRLSEHGRLDRADA
jgi:glutathione S-transferase